jgi:hypothetical protein
VFGDDAPGGVEIAVDVAEGPYEHRVISRSRDPVI